jgi:holo-[acyl-carrier protein] synthase
MIGLDLCSAARIRRVHERHRERFTDRVFTAGEVEESMGRRDPYPHLAARWAAKEAVFKVLGRVPGFRWKDIEVTAGKDGRPGLSLHGATAMEARRQGIGTWHVSISHEGDMAACVVMAAVGENEP